ELLDNQCDRLVVRAVVPRQHADVAELAQERAATRDLDHPAIVVSDRAAQQIERQPSGSFERNALGPNDLRSGRSAEEPVQKRRERLLAVADEDVVEVLELGQLALLFKRPGDRSAQDEGRLRIAAFHLAPEALDRMHVLVDAAE